MKKPGKIGYNKDWAESVGKSVFVKAMTEAHGTELDHAKWFDSHVKAEPKEKSIALEK